MRLVLHGGFGEKGRTSLAVESRGYRLLLDAGIKTSASGRADYHPAIGREALAATDAMVVTHGHEDHAAAIGWCIANGFRGRILMTRETRRDAMSVHEAYAEQREGALFEAASVETLPRSGDIALGPLVLSLGRAGHVAGGVWCRVDDGATRFLYCGDVVPASPVFAMDRVPACDVLAIDASYGDDAVPGAQRAREIAAWAASHAQGCVLPTPLSGRSLELCAIVPGALALAPGMRAALLEQLADEAWLVRDAGMRLAERIDSAEQWTPGSPLPRSALLCHDGMGMAGPSREILAMARATRHPVLFTGHVPAGSAGARMLGEGAASWIRLPTHPTLDENRAIVRDARAPLVIGHSCEAAVLCALARHIDALRTDVATGDAIDA